MEKEAFRFSGEGVNNYDNLLGPFLFEPYGKHIASLVPSAGINNVLEIACGTGRLTNHLYKQIPSSAKLIASDISPDMLALAKQKLSGTSIHFQTADAQQLPFEDNSFDYVLCQFGLMFLPDKQKGFKEIFRVLKPGGKFIFSTWDKTENIAVKKMFFNDLLLPFFAGEDTARFLIPFSLHDPLQLESFLENAGFKNNSIENIFLEGRADNAKQIVDAYLIKHSLANEVAAKDPSALEPMAARFQQALETTFGKGEIVCRLSAFIGTGEKK
jgi:ubiquinone/menaquinone biosynthesis C-methylase UbiE